MNITVDSLPAAEQAATARGRELLEAREALTRAEQIERTARDAHARAVELHAAAEVEHARLKSAAETAETEWQAVQTADLWREVERARSVRDQAELRTRALVVAVEQASATATETAQRTANAREALQRAEQAAQRADDVLRAWRKTQHTRDEAEAAREGARLREVELVTKVREEFNAEIRRDVGALLTRAVGHAAGLRDTVRELDKVLAGLRARSGVLRQRLIGCGLRTSTQSTPGDIAIETSAVSLVGVAIFRALAPGQRGPREFPVWHLGDHGKPQGVELDLVTEVVKLYGEKPVTPDPKPPTPPAPAPAPAARPEPAAPARSFVGRVVNAVVGG